MITMGTAGCWWWPPRSQGKSPAWSYPARTRSGPMAISHALARRWASRPTPRASATAPPPVPYAGSVTNANSQKWSVTLRGIFTGGVDAPVPYTPSPGGCARCSSKVFNRYKVPNMVNDEVTDINWSDNMRWRLKGVSAAAII